MTRAIEERLRAALSTRAAQVTQDRLRPAGPPPPPRRRLASWVLPATVAAAVMAAIAVPGAYAIQRLTADPQLAPPGLLHRSPLALRPDGPRGLAPTARTKEVSYDGMTLQIPAGWTLEEQRAAEPGACVWASSPDHCEFTVMTAYSGGYNVIHPAVPVQVSGQLSCDDRDAPVRTVDTSTVDIGGRPAEYRKFRMRCRGVESDFEQWTLGTRPGAKFHRQHIAAETEDAVLAAVASARFELAATDQPLNDFGFITGYSRTADGVRLDFDRATPVWRRWFEFDVENGDPRTDQYLVAAEGARVLDDRPGACRAGVSLADLCPLDTVLRRLDEGDSLADGGVPIRQIPVWLAIDAKGKVTSVGVARAASS